MIEVVELPVRRESGEGVGTLEIDQWSLPSVAYAAFFTEAEREEIGSFEELPAHERARWQSVAAHIARTVVSPIDEDLEQWRAEQQARLAEQVRQAPYSRELWRAMTRTTDLQKRVETLRTLLEQSRASAVTARSHSRRLASSAEALEHALWWNHPMADSRPDHDLGPSDVDSTTDPAPIDLMGGIDRPPHHHERMLRSVRSGGI